MTRRDEIDYYAACEREERRLADRTSEPGMSALHLSLAQLFHKLTAGSDETRMPYGRTSIDRSG